MENVFGKKLKELREKHFPGESLRRVSERIKPESSFFTYLSRIEAGIVKPSEQFLKQVRKAYSLTVDEYNDLVTSYLAQDVQESLLNLATSSKTKQDELVRQLFRKVKKKSNENTPNKKLGSVD